MNNPKKSSARTLAGKVILEVLSKPVFSNKRLSELLATSGLDDRDKGFCTELVYGTLRWKIPLEYSLRAALDKPGKIPPKVLAHCLVAAYQLQHLSETIPPHAAVNEAVSLVKRVAPGLSGLANAILRKLGSRRDEILIFERASSEEMATAFGIPLSLVQTIQNELPKSEWRDALVGLKDRPKVYFRHFDQTKVEGFVAHSFVPGAFFKESSQSLTETLTGRVVVQDPASQLSALLLNPQNGASVIDMCAAPGMKSLILKSLVGPKGSVISVDINSAKRDRMLSNMRRLNLPLEILIEDAKNLPQHEGYVGKFDYVMLDAPCSGLGTTRRHPEIALRFKEDNLPQITNLQKELLASAAKLLKTGGAMVYSVCSPLEKEGKENINWFLSSHPEFMVEDPRVSCPWLSEGCVTKENFVSLWPHRHDCDAFFAVRLAKR